MYMYFHNNYGRYSWNSTYFFHAAPVLILNTLRLATKTCDFQSVEHWKMLPCYLNVTNQLQFNGIL